MQLPSDRSPTTAAALVLTGALPLARMPLRNQLGLLETICAGTGGGTAGLGHVWHAQRAQRLFATWRHLDGPHVRLLQAPLLRRPQVHSHPQPCRLPQRR